MNPQVNYANVTERCDALTRAIVLPPSPLKPHAARHTKNPQKMIIRISSPAEDFSKIKFMNPCTPCFLRPGELRGRRSFTYSFVHVETPRPQGQIL